MEVVPLVDLQVVEVPVVVQVFQEEDIQDPEEDILVGVQAVLRQLTLIIIRSQQTR